VLVWLLGVYIMIGVLEALVGISKRLRDRAKQQPLPPTG